jgi:hypothetical protein
MAGPLFTMPCVYPQQLYPRSDIHPSEKTSTSGRPYLTCPTAADCSDIAAGVSTMCRIACTVRSALVGEHGNTRRSDTRTPEHQNAGLG